MNYRLIIFILSIILKFEALFLLPPALVGVFYGEHRNALVFLCVSALCGFLGLLLSMLGKQNALLHTREGFLAVSSGWIIMSVFGCLPFIFTGDIPSFTNALFETVSGFTTTGSSILTDVEAMSKSCLFWRSLTHWIGGMGVFVFIMALLPMMGGSTMNLMKAESTGPSVGKLVPKVKDTAKILYGIYIFMTILLTIILLFLGMNLFEALTLTFGTVGTGGFGLLNTSIGSYSHAVQYTIGIFMILSGINYSAYFCILCGKIKDAFKLEEVRAYLGVILFSILLITFNIVPIYGNIADAFRYSFFQVSSMITSTGYATADFDTWPALSKTVIVLIMFMGARAGSTGGGIKVSRIMILLKTIKKELSIMLHPQLVKKIKMDGRLVPHETVRATNVFFILYFITPGSSLLLISFDGYDFTTNFTAVLTTLSNMGPGLSHIGPTMNFSAFSSLSKYVLIFDMLAGRLELFPMFLLLLPSSWKKY